MATINATAARASLLAAIEAEGLAFHAWEGLRRQADEATAREVDAFRELAAAQDHVFALLTGEAGEQVGIALGTGEA